MGLNPDTLNQILSSHKISPYSNITSHKHTYIYIQTNPKCVFIKKSQAAAAAAAATDDDNNNNN